MKKTYIQPAIELVAVEVEQGIAMSTVATSTFSINNYESEEVDW